MFLNSDLLPRQTMEVSTAEQMREFDRMAAEMFGIPSIVLMENAGRHVAETVVKVLESAVGRRVCVIAGKGNNGGDGFVTARQLRDEGMEVSVLLLGDPAEVRGDARVNLDILSKIGLPAIKIDSVDQLSSILASSHLIVDALFGTGLHGDITGPAAGVIDAINSSGRLVVAVDIPSGLDADTGQILGSCVCADCTVTFALPKIGHLTYPGAAKVGKLVVAQIGIPQQLYDGIDIELVGPEWVSANLPRRPADGYKGTFGTTLVLAGSAGFTGAAAMSSEAAMRTGVGLCVLGVPASVQDILATKLTEAMAHGLPETDRRSLSAGALEPALGLAEKAHAIVLGPGLGHTPDTCEFVRKFVQAMRKPMLIDADGLNCLSECIDVLEGDHGDIVLTPHPGEMARLLGTSIDQIQSDRLGAAREAAARFKSVVVLKGARTLIADPSGKVYMNPTGNSGMGTGGTGDVLSGTIGGLLTQGISLQPAAVCGVYIHGRAGDIAAETIGQMGLVAGDVILSLPEALMELRE